MFKRIFILFFCVLSLHVFAQEGIPNKPQQARLVNDFANVLTVQQQQQLEKKLVNYYRESSTQIAVVTIKNLNGYEKADFATRLAQKWGIGSAKYDNGILLLIKPKYSNSKGEVFIATGYGLEGTATDLANGQIVRNIIIPAFKRNDYFEGIDKGADALIALTKGEYNDAIPPQQQEAPQISFWVVIIGFILLFAFLSTLKQKAKGQYQMSKKGGSIPMWMLLEMLTRGKGKGKGNFHDFNSGSGGFGGFGGGSFGGGGAGGSW